MLPPETQVGAELRPHLTWRQVGAAWLCHHSMTPQPGCSTRKEAVLLKQGRKVPGLPAEMQGTAGPRCQHGPGFVVLLTDKPRAESGGHFQVPWQGESSREEGSVVVTSFWLSDLGQAVVAVPAMSLISEFSAVGGLSRDAQPEKNLEIKNLEIKNLEMLHRPRKWGFKQVEGQSTEQCLVVPQLSVEKIQQSLWQGGAEWGIDLMNSPLCLGELHE